MGGWLSMNEGMGRGRGHIAVILCPRAGAAEGWTGWPASLEDVSRTQGEQALPTAAISFDFQPSAAGDALEVKTDTSRLKATLPANPSAFFRLHPELLAFALVTGIVPASHAGMYELKEN